MLKIGFFWDTLYFIQPTYGKFHVQWYLFLKAFRVFNKMVSIYGTPLGLVDESQNILLTGPNEGF